jgi:hypothetical protein
MKQLWEWTGTDIKGKTVTYQTEGPDVSEASMLEHLKASYHNLTITTLRRCDVREAKQSTGRVARHAYQYGIWDIAMRELSGLPEDRKERVRQTFNRDRLFRLAGVSRQGMERKLMSRAVHKT